MSWWSCSVGQRGLELSGNPSCVLMVGLHGSGKTTSERQAGPVAPQAGPDPLLVAADVYRPAAMDQLEKLGRQTGLPVYVARAGPTCSRSRARPWIRARRQPEHPHLRHRRPAPDRRTLVRELVRLRHLVAPQETLRYWMPPASGGIQDHDFLLGRDQMAQSTSSWTSGSSIGAGPAVSKMTVFRLLARGNSSARALWSTSVPPSRHRRAGRSAGRASRTAPWPPGDRRPPRRQGVRPA